MIAPNLFKICRHVSPNCPVESSIYGYYPSLPGNAFLLAWFLVLLLVNTILGIRYRKWSYMVALDLGCISEIIGYIGRIILYYNPQLSHYTFWLYVLASNCSSC